MYTIPRSGLHLSPGFLQSDQFWDVSMENHNSLFICYYLLGPVSMTSDEYCSIFPALSLSLSLCVYYWGWWWQELVMVVIYKVLEQVLLKPEPSYQSQPSLDF